MRALPPRERAERGIRLRPLDLAGTRRTRALDTPGARFAIDHDFGHPLLPRHEHCVPRPIDCVSHQMDAFALEFAFELQPSP